MSWVDQTDIEQVRAFQHYHVQSQSQKFAKLKENPGSHCDVEFIAGSRSEESSSITQCRSEGRDDSKCL